MMKEIHIKRALSKKEELVYFLEFLSHLYKLIKKYIFFILFISVLGGTLSFLIASFTKVKYQSELRFIVKSEGSGAGMNGLLGGIGGLSSMLSGNAMGSPLERTVEVVGSDIIILKSLLTVVRFERKDDKLINHFIRIADKDIFNSNDTITRGVYFSMSDTIIENLDHRKRKVLKYIESKIIPKSGVGLLTKSFDKKSGIVNLSVTHTNEEFAILLAKTVFYCLREFYVQQMVSSAANNVSILEKKVDSIRVALSQVQSSYARTLDQSTGLLFQEDKVALKKLSLREQLLIAMYGEAQKNLETFKFMNDSAIPSLTVIDMPFSPLKKIEKNKFLYMVGGLFLGGFLASLFIFIRLWFNNLKFS